VEGRRGEGEIGRSPFNVRNDIMREGIKSRGGGKKEEPPSSPICFLPKFFNGLSQCVRKEEGREKKEGKGGGIGGDFQRTSKKEKIEGERGKGEEETTGKRRRNSPTEPICLAPGRDRRQCANRDKSDRK